MRNAKSEFQIVLFRISIFEFYSNSTVDLLDN
jgi:hypothetical protein